MFLPKNNQEKNSLDKNHFCSLCWCLLVSIYSTENCDIQLTCSFFSNKFTHSAYLLTESPFVRVEACVLEYFLIQEMRNYKILSWLICFKILG